MMYLNEKASQDWSGHFFAARSTSYFFNLAREQKSLATPEL
jgi:hypothetical protein